MRRIRVDDGLTDLFNDGKYPCLAIVISVGTHAKIDLCRVSIGIVGGCELENAIHGLDRGKGAMNTSHLSGGARGTSCQSSGEQIES